jgi:hypothetical protein
MANGYSKQVRERAAGFARPRFEAGAYLTAAACSLEQQYRLQRGRRHNRHSHGWGVVCGLWVTPAEEAARPWAVSICPGYAIGPHGDEIELRERAAVDIAKFLWARPAPTFTQAPPRRVFIAVRYVETGDALRAVPGPACGCSEPEYAPSRIRDDFEAAALWEAPAAAPARVICGEPQECPACPGSPWLGLALVTLPVSPGQPVTAAMIDNGIRTAL